MHSGVDVWADGDQPSLLSLAASSGVAPLSVPLPGEPAGRFSENSSAESGLFSPGRTSGRGSLSRPASSAQLDGPREAAVDDAFDGGSPRGTPALRRASVSLPDLSKASHGDLSAQASADREGVAPFARPQTATDDARAERAPRSAASVAGKVAASGLAATCATDAVRADASGVRGAASPPSPRNAASTSAAASVASAQAPASSPLPSSLASPPNAVPSVAVPTRRRPALSRLGRGSAATTAGVPAAEAPVGTSPDDLEVYVSFRFFRENAQFLTKRAPPGFAEALRDAGICHYTAIVRDPRSGALVEFDFGPGGGRDVEFVNPQAKAIWKRLRAGGRALGERAKGAEARAEARAAAAAQDALFVSRDLPEGAAEGPSEARRLETPPASRGSNAPQAATVGARVAVDPAVSAAAPSASIVAPTPSPASASSSPEPARGKVRETLLSTLPPQCAFVGRTRLSLEEIRAFTRAAAVDRTYRLHVSDCRHFADELVLASTGVPGACARTVAAHWPAARERYGPAGSIVRAGHLFTNHENWVYVRAAGRAGALAAALGAGRRALAAVSSLSTAAAARGRLALLARSVLATSVLPVLSIRNRLLQNGLRTGVAQPLRVGLLQGGFAALRARLLRDPAVASQASQLAAAGAQAAGPRAAAALGVSRAAEAAGGLVAAASGRPRAVGAALAAAVAATAATRGGRELVAARARVLEQKVRVATAGRGGGSQPEAGSAHDAGSALDRRPAIAPGWLAGGPAPRASQGRLRRGGSLSPRLRGEDRAIGDDRIETADGDDRTNALPAQLPGSLSSRVTSALGLLPFRRRAGAAGRKGRAVVVLRRNGKQGDGRAAGPANAPAVGERGAIVRRRTSGADSGFDGPPPALPAAIPRDARRRALEALGGARARAVSAVRRAGEAARRPEERRGLLAIGIGGFAAIAARLGEAAARGRD